MIKRQILKGNTYHWSKKKRQQTNPQKTKHFLQHTDTCNHHHKELT